MFSRFLQYFIQQIKHVLQGVSEMSHLLIVEKLKKTHQVCRKFFGGYSINSFNSLLAQFKFQMLALN